MSTSYGLTVLIILYQIPVRDGYEHSFMYL